VFKISSFTYEKPNEKAFFQTLVNTLTLDHRDIVELLHGGKCAIADTTTFSGKRWDAYYTTIYFYIPFAKLQFVTGQIIETLIAACDGIMPKEAGLDVMNVEFSPLLEEAETLETSILDIEDAAGTLSQEIQQLILPGEVKQKGTDMAGVYLYLYCVENSLRLFIETAAKRSLGEQYFESLKVSKETLGLISGRKAEESRKKWLPIRGDSDLFYMDFKDLAYVIQNNWEIFKSYFPDMNWIVPKILELADCRDLVAHNSHLGTHQRNVIKVYYTSILMQLDRTLRTAN